MGLKTACIACVGIVLAATTPADAASYTFTTLNEPDATGINNLGQIVGYYVDINDVSHGFLYSGGTYTVIDVPGALTQLPPGNPGFRPVGTQVYGINDSGQIVGVFQDSMGEHGFVDTGGVFTTISVPVAPSAGGTSQTDAYGINNAGQIVGSVRSNNPSGGFIDTSGNFTILAPFSYSGDNYNLSAVSINNLGQVILHCGCGGGIDLLYSNGNYATINEPSANGYTSYSAAGINDLGQIVGGYFDGSNHGFVDTGGSFATIDPPGNNGYTSVYGINNEGDLVGYYDDASGIQHAYLATPIAVAAPEPPSLALLCIGVLGLGIVGRRKRA